MRTYESKKSATTAQTPECRALIFRHSMMTSTMESATVESFTVEPIMKSAKAFAEKSALVIPAIAVAVRGIAVASVVPPSVETSRQAEGRNQERTKDNQFYFHYLMRRQAGRMTSGAEDLPFAAGLVTAGPAFRTPASVPT
jgi:hypothetical protein